MADPARAIESEFIPDEYEDETGKHQFAPWLSQDDRRKSLERSAELKRIEDDWVRRGKPWNKDSEALLNRMSS